MVVTDVAVSKDYVKKLYIVSLVSKGKKSDIFIRPAEWVLYFKGAEHKTRERGARRTSLMRDTRKGSTRTSLTRDSRFVLASR